MEFWVKVRKRDQKNQREGTSPATLSARNRTEPHSGFYANKTINYSYKFLWRAEEDQPLGDQEPTHHQWGGEVTGPAGCWEVSRFSRSSLELEVFEGSGRLNGMHDLDTLASSQENAATSAGCENLMDQTLIRGCSPVFWFKIRFWPK